MRVRLVRDYVILGQWRLAGDIVDVDAGLAERLRLMLFAEVLEDAVPAAPETAMLEPSAHAARPKRGRAKRVKRDQRG